MGYRSPSDPRRRNLTKQAWLDLGFKRAELLKPRAEDNRLANLKQNQSEDTEGQKSDFRSYDTLTEAADYAGVSRDTAAKYKRVMSDAPDEIKQKVRTGDTFRDLLEGWGFWTAPGGEILTAPRPERFETGEPPVWEKATGGKATDPKTSVLSDN